MGKKAKEKFVLDTLSNARTLIIWYTAWLMAEGVIPEDSPVRKDINKPLNKFFKEDEDMVRRFFRLPDKP